MDITIQEVARHRNGVCGTGFYAVRFWDKEEKRQFVATVFGYNPACYRDEDTPDQFDDDLYADPHVAVLDADLAHATVEFGVNSWRGDRYADDLFLAIDKHSAAERERIYA
jgi:hypothetical protein